MSPATVTIAAIASSFTCRARKRTSDTTGTDTLTDTAAHSYSATRSGSASAQSRSGIYECAQISAYSGTKPSARAQSPITEPGPWIESAAAERARISASSSPT